jgi:phospholipid/cholesterol/gamma-HCH transport system permease protein
MKSPASLAPVSSALPSLTVEPLGEGRVLRLSGRLTVARSNILARKLRDVPGDARPLVLDLSNVEHMDTVGAWLIHRAARNQRAAGGSAIIEGASEAALALIERVGEHDKPVRIRPDTGHPLARIVGEFGAGFIRVIDTFGGFLAFLGETFRMLGRAILEPRRFRVVSIVRQMELVGVNALAIIGLMSFLVGIVIAQQGAVQLRQFGAEVFTINLVGRSVIRELGVLMTAIMVAGRSGSAFAAQIGSMKLAEEVDALRTIGVSPVEALTLPRLVALVLLMPLLAFYASLAGLLGGALFSWVSLDIPLITFIQRTQEVVPMTDLWIALIKAPVFGLIIAVTGCYHGMQVAGNAEDVGLRTTAAVVQSIFLVIVLDAFFAVFFTALGWI